MEERRGQRVESKLLIIIESEKKIVDRSNYERLYQTETGLMSSDGVQCSGPRGKQAKPILCRLSSRPLLFPSLARLFPRSSLSPLNFPRPQHTHTPLPTPSSKLRPVWLPRHTHISLPAFY